MKNTAIDIDYVKFLITIVVVVLLPLAALVVYFLKAGITRQVETLKTGMDAQVAVLKGELNGYGGRLNTDENNLVKVADAVGRINATIVDTQHDTLEAFRASASALQTSIELKGTTQLNATHALDVRLGRLEERADGVAALKDFCSSLEKLAQAIVATTAAREK